MSRIGLYCPKGPTPLAGSAAVGKTKMLVRSAVQGTFELLWSMLFTLAGRVLRPRARLWSSAGGATVLVVAPHPDDEVAGCAGAIGAHLGAGDRVVVAIATDGRLSRAYGLGPEEMASTRRAEAAAAAATLGVDRLEWLGLPEGAWRPEDLIAALRELLDRLRPDVVYAPSRVDFHFEHEQVARALAAALGQAPSPAPILRVYALQVPLTPALTNLILPLAAGDGEVRKAVESYHSQVGSLLRCLRHRRYLGRLYGRPGPVEELWEMSAAQYRRLHAETPSRPPPRTFRGLRYYAWSDPLAYLRGRRDRRRLAALGASPDSGEQPLCRVRPYRPGDEPEIVRLYERSLGRGVEAGHWRWKFARRPSPAPNVWLAVDAGERPCFHYAGMPCQVVFPGGPRHAMVLVDIMTEPRRRRQGILTAGAAVANEAWKRAGVALVMGLPNEQWGTRLSALGYRPLFRMRWLVCPLRPELLLARRLGVPALAGLKRAGDLWNALRGTFTRRHATLELGDAERAGEEFDALWQVCAAEGRLSVLRGSEWVSWRYFSVPGVAYRVITARRSGRLAGYLAYRAQDVGGRRTGLIAELVTPRADAAARRALLGAALDRLRDLGAVTVRALAAPGSELHRSYRRAGFVLRQGAFTFYCGLFAADLGFDEIRDPRRWQLHGGDFDVV